MDSGSASFFVEKRLAGTTSMPAGTIDSVVSEAPANPALSPLARPEGIGLRRCVLPRWPLQNDRESAMKISARDVLEGKIVEVVKGQTTAHVRIDIGGGKIVTASITNEAVDDLGLAVGKEAHAVIKASDVLVAVD
jgi:molybdopterin-binding protein